MTRRESRHHIGLKEEDGTAILIHDDDPKRQRAPEQRGPPPWRKRIQDARRTTRNDLRPGITGRGEFRKMQDIDRHRQTRLHGRSWRAQSLSPRIVCHGAHGDEV